MIHVGSCWTREPHHAHIWTKTSDVQCPGVAARVIDLRVSWNPSDAMCDLGDCSNYSTHDVSLDGNVRRSCTVHLREMITV